MIGLLLLSLALSAPDSCPATATRLDIDLERSVVRWRGTKFFGLGSHEGEVRLKEGAVCVERDAVVGGWFVADMTTIVVTDIPADDPIPRNRLRKHLLSEDFFHVERYPEARFRIGSATRENGRLFSVLGALTIRDHTNAVRFYARGWTVNERELQGTARFAIDRQKYDVSYVGSTVKDDLVDDEITLEISIVARRPSS